MTAAHHNISLAWCLEYGQGRPADHCTARNVLSCIVSHARQSAATPAEVAAVAAAEANARCMLAEAAP